MNIKSYLKGIGVGIIVASLVLIIAGNMNKMSDADVIKRAKELGMVEASAEIQNTEPVNAAKENTVAASDNSDAATNKTETSADDKTAQNISDTNNTNVKASDNSSINTTEDSKTNTSDISSPNATEDSKANTEQTSTDASADNKTDASSSEANNNTSTSQNADNTTDETVKVEVKSGMSSESVSLAVKNAGLVDNDTDFNKYLCENGYDKRLRVGTFDIPSGSDFETISKYLCGIK